MGELALFAGAAAVILVAGVAIGMLVAPALARWSDRADADEEPGAGDP